MTELRRLTSGYPRLGRNVVSGHRSNFSGFVPSAKRRNDYRLVAYESLLERDFIHLLEDDNEVLEYRDRDEPLRFVDSTGKERTYHPDFTVVMKTRTICVEVKPSARLATPKVATWMAEVRRAVESSDRFQGFVVMTEQEIRHPGRLYNAELRNSARQTKASSVSDERAFRVMETVRLRQDRPTVGKIRQESGLGHGAFRAILAAAVGRSLHLGDPHLPIGDDTEIGSGADL